MFGQRKRQADVIARRRLKRRIDQSIYSGTWNGPPTSWAEEVALWHGRRVFGWSKAQYDRWWITFARLGFYRKQRRSFSGHGQCCWCDRTYKVKGWRKKRFVMLRDALIYEPDL
jgi:hypothetical protein